MQGIYRVLGSVACVVASLMYCGTMIAAQILGKNMPRFQLNFIRFASQFIVSAAAVAILRKPVLAFNSWIHVAAAVAAGITYSLSYLTLNLAPIYVPVGNVECVEVVTYIVITIGVAMFERKVGLLVIFCGLLSCVGVTLLLQPDFLFGNSAKLHNYLDPCPCMATDGVSGEARPEECHIQLILLRENSSFDNSEESSVSIEQIEPIYESILVTPFGLSLELYGYTLAIVAGVLFFCFTSVSQRTLLPNYHFTFVSFWLTLVGTVFNATIMLSAETLVLVRAPTCVAMVVVTALCACSSMLVVGFSLLHTPPAQYAILLTLAIVALFIAQTTVLSNIRAVHGNALEHIGVVLVLLACILEPALEIAKMNKKEKLKQDEKPGKKRAPQVDELAPLIPKTNRIQGIIIPPENPREKTKWLE